MRREDTLPNGRKVTHVGGENIGPLKEFLDELEALVVEFLKTENTGIWTEIPFNETGLLEIDTSHPFEIPKNDLTRAIILRLLSMAPFVQHITTVSPTTGKPVLRIWVGHIPMEIITSGQIVPITRNTKDWGAVADGIETIIGYREISDKGEQ
jgi:hypothetical protein